MSFFSMKLKIFFFFFNDFSSYMTNKAMINFIIITFSFFFSHPSSPRYTENMQTHWFIQLRTNSMRWMNMRARRYR